MAVIDRFRNINTVFEVFEVPKEEANRFIQEFTSFIQNHLKGRVGLVSFNLHYNEEEGLVINYGQWKGQQDYQNFLEDNEIKSARDHFYSKMIRSTQTKVVFTT